MKTTLPKKSLSIKPRLDQIVKVILDIAREQAAMIILFGSYARGNWVRDWYVEDHITYSYESDIDILLVTKNPKYAGYQGSFLKQKIDEKLQRAGLGWRPFLAPPITLIIEPIQRINKEVEKNRYFFLDIKKEGVILYDSGEFKLAEPKELDWKETREIAKEYFEQWFPQGNGFMDATVYMLQRNNLNLAAFQLHQATESYYNTILLVFSSYKVKYMTLLRSVALQVTIVMHY